MDSPDRHSDALQPEIITDPEEKARREARNGLRQFDRAIEQIEYWLQPERPFRLRPSAIMDLNRLALEGLSNYAGRYRPAAIAIKGSKHTPPDAHLVAEHVEDLCNYVNANWNRSPIHLASYVYAKSATKIKTTMPRSISILLVYPRVMGAIAAQVAQRWGILP